MLHLRLLVELFECVKLGALELDLPFLLLALEHLPEPLVFEGLLGGESLLRLADQLLDQVLRLSADMPPLGWR